MIAFVAAAITLFVVAADQISKYLVVSGMELYSEIPIIKGFFSLYRTENRGAAFSMLSEHRWVFMLLSSVSIVAMTVFLVMMYKRHALLTVSLSMVLGGGIANMIDRIRLGYVVDFLRPDFVDFATFNIADSFITVGAVLLGIYLIFLEPRVEKRERAAKSKASESELGNGETPDE